MRKTSILLLSLILAACNLRSGNQDFRSGPDPETPAAELEYTQCGWVWDTQALPDLSADVQSALEAAGLMGVSAYAEAYGEDCLNASGEVDHFAVMETDFHITLQVAAIYDTELLGASLEQILVVLDSFPPESTPGPQAGYIGITFQAGNEELRLWFTVDEGVSARALGLH